MSKKKKNKNRKKKKYLNVQNQNSNTNANTIINQDNKKESLNNSNDLEESIEKENIIIDNQNIDNSNDLEEIYSKVVEDTTLPVVNQKSEKKGTKKGKIIRRILLIFILIIILTSAISYASWYLNTYVYCMKDFIEIEVGTDNKIDPKSFLKNPNQSGNIKILTDLSKIDFNKVSNHSIELEFDGKKYTSTLKLIDTVPPVVEFKDVNAHISYKIDPNDFIKSKKDITEMTVEIENIPTLDKYQEYPLVIIVRDEGGNETKGNVILNTSYIRTEYTLEYGNKLTYKDLLVNPKEDKNIIPKKELDKINKAPPGVYELKTENRGSKVTTKIKIQDTIAPKLSLRSATIYNDEEKIDKNKFIASVSDKSKVTTELKTEIQYKKVGTQTIEIVATDASGNKTTKKTTLKIIKDTVGPVFYGLKNMSISKNSSPNWKKGVSAKDSKDGKCDFSVDSSKVNLSKAGTYIVKYTSKDKSGNTSTKSITVTINPNAQDVQNKVRSWLKKSGHDPVSIKNYVASHVKYSSSTKSSTTWAAWLGMTTGRGDCYVHASLTHMMLQAAGYSCRIVKAKGGKHYWNLVNVGGKWRHLDSTPPRYSKNGLMTDDQREKSLHDGITWDKDKYPKAE